MSIEYLARLVGEWSGKTQTWLEPGAQADESPWRGTFCPLLGGQFIQHEYAGEVQGKPFSGMQTWAFNPTLKRWECSWIDSFHTGNAIMYSVGTGPEPNVLGEWFLPDGTAWGWRTTLSCPNPDELVQTMYIITPEGREAKGVETRYIRQRSSAT